MSHVSANERIMTCAVPNGSKWCHSLFRRTSEMPCKYSALVVHWLPDRSHVCSTNSSAPHATPHGYRVHTPFR